MSHATTIEPFRHAHDFLGADHERNARRTWAVVALTAGMMVVEIVCGWLFGSMALLADGVHMATHAGALGVAGLAYGYARRRRDDARYAFGTGKVGDLAGFASALILAMIALLVAAQSVERLLHPVAVAFEEAIAVAALGLAVNLASAALLAHGHTHYHDDTAIRHAHGGEHHGHVDHNLLAAYFHVLADALTSVLAIAGLVCGRWFGWTWMDPLVGLVGAAVIARWSFRLLRQTAAVLLDASATALSARVAEALEQGGDRIADLHVWRLGPGHHAAVVSLVTATPHEPGHYKERLLGLPGLSHVTIEVHRCPGEH